MGNILLVISLSHTLVPIGAIKCALGEESADIIIRSASIVNVFTEEIIEADIAVKDGFIARIGNTSDLRGERTKILDADGLYAVPAFIDAHIHVESSMLCLTEFARTIIPHGTGSIITDFHELANVLGVKGLMIILDEAKRLPINVFIMAPSCVPAAPGVDTAGSNIGPKDIETLMDMEEILGLGEMMNYPGVLSCSADVLSLIHI